MSVIMILGSRERMSENVGVGKETRVEQCPMLDAGLGKTGSRRNWYWGERVLKK
jgi:hypothetical protein